MTKARAQVTALDPAAPILPDHSLGGVELRSRIADVQHLIAHLRWKEAGAYRLLWPFEAEYSFSNEGILIAADVRNGKVFRLSATTNYLGALFGKIRPGMRIGDAVEADSR